MTQELRDDDYRRLLALRTGLRRFLRWSEEQVAAVGLQPVQHLLLLSIRGHADPRGPTIGEVAEALLLRHHSAVELVDRAEKAGLVERRREGGGDLRVVRLGLTPHGSDLLTRLSALHLEELERLGPGMSELWRDLGKKGRKVAEEEAP